MDTQGRLTKMKEWQVGEFYQWPKGDDTGPIRKCVKINRAEDSVSFANGDDTIEIFKWRGRFVHV